MPWVLQCNFMGAWQQCTRGRRKTPTQGINEQLHSRSWVTYYSPAENSFLTHGAPGYSSRSSTRVNGTRRQLPQPVPSQQLPLALLSLTRMRRHTAPRAIKSPQRGGKGSPPLLSVIDRPITGSDASVPASAPAGQAGGRHAVAVATAGRGACWEGCGGCLAAMLVGPSGEVSRPPIDLALSTAPICRNLWYRCGAD